jgi:hypothetical protein
MIGLLCKYASIEDSRGNYEIADATDQLIKLAALNQKEKLDASKMLALLGFMGWLTARKKKSGPFSYTHEATEAVELVEEYCKSQGWDVPDTPDGWAFGNAFMDKLKPVGK